MNSKAEENNIKYYSKDSCILSLMYHRFDENKYPSTNIRMDVFKEQMSIIKTLNYEFYDPQRLQKKFDTPKNKKKILITIDDAFLSFYKIAWPYLKSKKVPFILFVSTEAVGKTGYMSWEQIQEVEKEPYAYIGNHSHSHGYLVDLETENFLSDINTSIKIFNQRLGYNPIFFSYPFGEYSKTIKNFISKNFATVAVEACSLCVVPKASLMYISAKVDNRLANASSAAVSSGLNLRFSNSATSPFLRSNSWCLSLISKKSEINFTLRFNKFSSSGIIFFRENSGSSPLGRPRCDTRIQEPP